MESDENKTHLDKGLALLKRGKPSEAVRYFEEILEGGTRNPACLSFLGLAIARSRGDFVKAERLCKEAIRKEFYWPHFYRNLAEVYLLWGKKSWAIKTLEKGLRIDGANSDLLKELEKLGSRAKPPIPFLSRANPVNKFIGKFLSKTGLR